MKWPEMLAKGMPRPYSGNNWEPMHRLPIFLSALWPTRLGVLFAVLIGLGVGFWQWSRPPRPRVVLEDMGSRSFGLPGPFFSSDGRLVVIFHKDPGDLHFFSLTLWDAQTGQKKFDLLSPSVLKLEQVKDRKGFQCWDGAVFSPDGQKVACLVQKQIGNLEDVPEGKIHIWDVGSGKKLATFEEKDASAMAFSPEGKLLALRDDSLWDVADNKKLRQLIFEGEEVFGRSPQLILLWCPKDVLKVWNLTTGTLVAEQQEILNFWKKNRVSRWMNPFFVIHPLDTEKVFLFNLFTGQKKEFNKEHSSFAINPDGQTIAVDHSLTSIPQESWWGRFLEWLGIRHGFSTRWVTLKAIPSGQEIIVLKGCMYPEFSPDGETLVASGTDGSLQLWDLPIRKPIGKILGLAGLAAAATLLAFKGFGWLRRRRYPATNSTGIDVTASSGQVA